MNELRLRSEFTDVSADDWAAAAQKALRGAELASLRSYIYEDVFTEPLYTRDTAGSAARQSGQVDQAPFMRGALPRDPGRPWTIIQLLDHLDLNEARRQLHDDYGNGVRAFWLQFAGHIPYGGGFLGANKLDALETLFDGIPLDDIALYVSGGFDAIAAAGLVAALIEKKGVPPEKIKGSTGFDPISLVAAKGHIPAERNRIMADAVDAATYFREKSYGWQPFLVSGRAWHQAGGSAREELGFVLASGVACWRALIDAGWPLEDAADAIGFSLTADADLFLTIAKFRAMRALWARATEAAGLAPRNPPLTAEMSFRMVTERDSYVNLLRASAAAFGAGVAGAEAILLLPFNTQQGPPDGFARRMARNTHLILQEESRLGQVADAAGGSYYVETLSHKLAAAAWNAFRDVEAEGGILAALESGSIGRKLTAVNSRRATNIARNQDKITGVSSYPNIAEESLPSGPDDLAIDVTALDEEGDVPQLPEANRGKRFAAIVSAADNGATLKALERATDALMERFSFIPSVEQRTAEPFESLRTASDRALSRIRTRPPVFLANLGALADYNMRASWAASFFAAGGIEAVDEGGFAEIDTLVRSFQLSPAPVACICASDTTLAEMPGVATALKNGGAAFVYLAADPGVLAKLGDEQKRGIDRIIYDGCDMLMTLTELHELMRVKDLGESESEDFEDDEDSMSSPNGS